MRMIDLTEERGIEIWDILANPYFNIKGTPARW